MGVCCFPCTTPVCSILRPVTSIPASLTVWRLHSTALIADYIFIRKYIAVAIKTSNTRLVIPVVMITIVALHFFTFTVCEGLKSLLNIQICIVRECCTFCFVSNRNLKGFSSKQYDKACKTPLTLLRISVPVTSTVHVLMTTQCSTESDSLNTQFPRSRVINALRHHQQ